MGADPVPRPSFARQPEPALAPQACAVVTGRNVRKLVLIVDDDADDRDRIARSFEECASDVDLQFLATAGEAADYVCRRCAQTDCPSVRRPSLVLLETELALGDGRELLRAIRRGRESSTVPIVVLSKRHDSDAIRACYRLGANSYFAKPATLEGFRSVIGILETYWLRRASLPA